jgi:hypothetical protein
MPDWLERPMVPQTSNRPEPTGQPMHARDRLFYVILTWSTIPAALVVGCFIAWASGQLSAGWAVAGGAAGLSGMAAATIYALEKKPSSPRYPGPIVITIAVITWALIGWQTWVWFHAPNQPIQGYTRAQLDDAAAKAKDAATKPLLEKLDQANQNLDQANKDKEAFRQTTAKQIADAVAKATAQSDTPINVDKLPTSLKLLFKAGDIEEIASQNVIWTKLLVEHEQKVTTVFGERPNTIPTWAIVVIFKKPIIYKDIQSDDHGAGLPVPEKAGTNPRYAVIEFGSHVITYSYQNVLVDLTFK